MLPVGQKRQNESLEQEDSDDSEHKPMKRNGRRKIKIEYIEDKNRRHITFSKRKAGIMKKAYELSTLTGTQVLLLVVSETGLVYTFTTTKLQPIVTKPEGKNLIQACLNTPDPSMPDMNSDSKLDEAGYMSRQSNEASVVGNSNTSPVPVVNRIPEDTSKNQLSPQTASSHSPMMQQSAPNTIRQQHQPMVPNPSVAAPPHPTPNNQAPQNNGPVNYSQQPNQPQHHHNAQPQMGMSPYKQQRYPPHPGYNGNLPQPTYPPQQQQQQQQQQHYGASQQPYYQTQPNQSQQPQQQQGGPNGPAPLGYWAFNDPQGAPGSGNVPQQQRQHIKQEHA